MAGMGPTVTLNFAGDARSLRRTINEVSVGLGVVAAAGVVGAASLGLVPLAFAGLGIAAVKETDEVKLAFESLDTYVKTKTAKLAEPIAESLVDIAGRAKESFDRISPSLGRIFEMTAPMVDRLANSVMRFTEDAMPGFEQATRTAAPIIETMATGIESLAPRFNEFFAILSENQPILNEAMRVFFEVLGQMIPVLAHIIVFLAQFSAVILPLAPYILGVVVGLRILITLLRLGSAIVTGFRIAFAILNVVMAANPFVLIVILIGLLVAALVYAWNNSETFRNIVLGVWERVKAFITQAVARIRLAIEWFKNLPTLVSEWFQRAKDGAIEKFTQLVEWVKGLPGRIKEAVGNLGTLLYNAGRDLLTGLWDGIKGAAGWLRDKIAGFFGSLLPGWAKDFLGIGSPSKVFRDEVGKWIPEGLAEGIQRNLDPIRKAANEMSAATMPRSNPVDISGNGHRMQNVNVYVNQTSGSPAETGRMVALALRTVG